MFLTPSKTDGRVRSQQGAPTTCNLITGQLGCGHRAKFSPSLEGGEGVEEEEGKEQPRPQGFSLKKMGGAGKALGTRLGKEVFDKQHIAAIFDVKTPQTP